MRGDIGNRKGIPRSMSRRRNAPRILAHVSTIAYIDTVNSRVISYH